MAAFKNSILFLFVLLLVRNVLSNDLEESTGREDLDDLPRVPISVHSHEVLAGAAFFLEELQDLSDSGIYKTLEVRQILSAATQKGVFHDNLHLTVHLSSPYLKGGKEWTQHEVMVMTSMEDGVKSFAIDNFPEMEEDAVEEFWIKKVDEHRRWREESFAKIEKEYEMKEKTRKEEL
eukprot:g6543.t1